MMTNPIEYDKRQTLRDSGYRSMHVAMPEVEADQQHVDQSVRYPAFVQLNAAQLSSVCPRTSKAKQFLSHASLMTFIVSTSVVRS